MTRGHRSSTVLYDYLHPEVERRLEQRQCDDPSVAAEKPVGGLDREVSSYMADIKQDDGIQWLIDTSPRKYHWDADRLVGEVMGVWYGSVHTLAIVSIIAPRRTL